MSIPIHKKDIPNTICDAIQEMWEVFCIIAPTNHPRVKDFIMAKDRAHGALSDWVAPGEEEVFLVKDVGVLMN